MNPSQVLAQNLANLTGATVIAMRGTKVSPVDINEPNTSFEPYNRRKGQWYVFKKGEDPHPLNIRYFDVANYANEVIGKIRANFTDSKERINTAKCEIIDWFKSELFRWSAKDGGIERH